MNPDDTTHTNALPGQYQYRKHVVIRSEGIPVKVIRVDPEQVDEGEGAAVMKSPLDEYLTL